MGEDLLRHGVIGAFAWLVLPGAAVAEDKQTDVPLAPSEAAGVWTLESGGQDLCTISLKAAKAGEAGYGLSSSPACGGALPAGAAGWSPTGDGMSINGADGRVLVAFNRWSNSLFVSHRASGVDLQLKRGGPGD